ncbi:unnamed protein product [Knipowitschia caucasica]|uniref:Lysosome-associated membrane glycoprotein 1 n=1 Tax=Knipowitschia caucasica TaxID=637954 RepID=A0AAV2JX12_KNICA
MAPISMRLYMGLILHIIVAAVTHQGASDLISTPEPPPTTPPPQGPGIPAEGDYRVKNENGTVCLKANMALQINISLPSAPKNASVQNVFNLIPNETSSFGSCDKESAILKLNSGQRTELTFRFTINTTSNKYNLEGLSILATLPDMMEPVSFENDSLDYLRGRLGFSYRCRSEQTLVVTQDFSLNTYLLHVQPFGLTGDVFGSALECLLDEDDLVIPIVVGVALAGLVFIVLLAYLIGRKRSHAGYQTI